MHSFFIWPYEETEFQINKSEQIFSLKTPWLKSSFKVPVGERLVYEQAIAMTSHAPNPKSLEVIKDAFSQINNYPYFYFLPRQELAPDKVIKNIVWPTPHKEHPWDKKAALQLAQVSVEKYDPFTLLSILRKYFLLECKQQIKDDSIFTIITRYPDFEKSRRGLALAIRQIHYIYEVIRTDCKDVVSLHRDCNVLAAKYIEKAKHDEKVLGLAIGTMSFKPEDIFVFETTKKFADKLRESAKTDVLEFACLADITEHLFLSKEKPLSEILRDNGFWHSVNDVQEQLNRFSMIGNNEGLKIVSGMGAIPESVAKKIVDKTYQYTLEALEIIKERYRSF